MTLASSVGETRERLPKPCGSFPDIVHHVGIPYQEVVYCSRFADAVYHSSLEGEGHHSHLNSPHLVLCQYFTLLGGHRTESSLCYTMGRLARLFGRKTTPLETATDEKHGSDSAAASTGTPLETATDEKHVSDSADASTRESVRGNLGVDAIDVMADLILVECSALGWFPTEDRGAHGPATGVCIRSKYGSIRSCPPDHPGLKGFEDAVFALNSRVAIKMRSKAVEVAVRNHM